MDENCSNCSHSVVSFFEAEDGPTLTCRRYPPQIFVLDGEPTQASPDVGTDHWCGEWQDTTSA